MCNGVTRHQIAFCTGLTRRTRVTRVVIARRLQLSLHENRVRQWSIVIGRAATEAHAFVKRKRCGDEWESVELHGRVSGDFSLRDDSFGQFSAETLAAKGFTDEKTFHFANGFSRGPESDAARRLITFHGEQ